MERVQSRRRIGIYAQENNVSSNRLAKNDLKPTEPTVPRTAFGEVGNKQPAVVGRFVKPLKKTTVAPAKPILKTKVPILKTGSTTVVGTAPTTKLAATTKVSKLLVNPHAQKEEVKPGLLAKRFEEEVTLVSKSVLQRAAVDVNQLKGIYDIDLEDDPQLVSEYVQDIVKYLLQLEAKYPVRKDFLKGHLSTKSMRTVLVNWMADVCQNYKWMKETLHMSVSLVDRYLQANKKITKESLQLVGAVAMLVAAKYEEIHPPTLGDLVYVCDDSFSSDNIIRMELDMLKRLKFGLGRPLPISFLRRFSKVMNAPLRQHILAKYIIDLALMEYDLCHIVPSMQAAAACCLAKYLLFDDHVKIEDVWSDLLVHYTTYRFDDIKSLVYEFAAMLIKAEGEKHQDIRKIYGTSVNGFMSSNRVLQGTKVKQLAAMAVIIKMKLANQNVQLHNS